MESSTSKKTTLGSEGYLREQLEKSFKELKQLKQFIELLEKENSSLKKSLYELSASYTFNAPIPFTLNQEVSSVNNATLSDTIPSIQYYIDSKTNVERKDSKLFTVKNDLKGHAGPVYCSKFSPDGKLIASGSFDKTVRIWDYSNSTKEAFVFSKHSLVVSEVSWSPNGTQLVSGSYDQSCRLWDIESGKSVDNYEFDSYVKCVSFSQDGFVYATKNCIGFQDIRQGGDQSCRVNTDSPVQSKSLCGDHFICGDAKGAVTMYDVRNLKIVNQINGTSFVSGVSCMAKDDDVMYAVNSYDNTVKLYFWEYNSTHQKLIHTFKGVKSASWPIKSSIYNPLDSSLFPDDVVLVGSGSAEPSAFIYQYGPQGGELLQRLDGHTERVYGLEFRTHDAICCTYSADTTIKVWYPRKRRNNN